MSTGAEPGLGWQPATRAERYRAIDVLRGVALFGVLMINLLTVFRISLLRHILTFHADPGVANHVVDILAAGLLEFKAFSLFSFLFGVGTAIQAERATGRNIRIRLFLVRRFLVLLAFGLCHLFLIWNGDILTLYAVCGLLLVPFIGLSPRALFFAGAGVMMLPYVIALPVPWPSNDLVKSQAVQAAAVYTHGTFGEILAFRWHETIRFILPLLWWSLPRTAGLMLWGVAAWRSGLLRDPEKHATSLRGIFVGGILFGGSMTALHVYSKSAGNPDEVLSIFGELGSAVPLALGCAAGLLLWLRRRTDAFPAVAALGQMALTNYLAQSIILGFIFYGYGLGLFGKLGSARAALIGIALYAAQLAFSRAWLRRFRFGPFEWLWRSLTYGRSQQMVEARDVSNSG